MNLEKKIDRYLTKKLAPIVDAIKGKKEKSRVNKQLEDITKNTGNDVRVLVVCTSSFFINNEDTILTKFRDSSGKVYTWFHANNDNWKSLTSKSSVSVGNIYFLRAKVRKESRHKGILETQVCKVKLVNLSLGYVVGNMMWADKKTLAKEIRKARRRELRILQHGTFENLW